MVVSEEQGEHDLLKRTCGVLVVLICKWRQRESPVPGVGNVKSMLTWKDVCGRGADHGHKGAFHQTFRGDMRFPLSVELNMQPVKM